MLQQRASYAQQEYEVERVVLNALATGMGLRSLIVCAFSDLALPSSRRGGPIHLTTTRRKVRACEPLDITRRVERQRSAG